MFMKIIDIRESYQNFTEKNNAKGYCVGFCLKWLGDILNKNKHGYKNGDFFVDINDRAKLKNLMERAKKKHEGYQALVRECNAYVGENVEHMDLIAQYNDLKQRGLESKNKQVGLNYKNSNFDSDNREVIAGLEWRVGGSSSLQGVMISFSFDNNGKRVGHVVAAIRATAQETYFFDPNRGLYHIMSENPGIEIKRIISRIYTDHCLLSQIVVS